MLKTTIRPSGLVAVAVTMLIAAPAMSAPESPQEMFERAETLYRQLEVVDPSGQESSWSRVASAFSDVASRYPESPLAAEALWRMSGIYAKRGAAGENAATLRQMELYRELVQRYPESPRAPEAMLRLAVDAENAGGAGAATLYTGLLQRYPNTPQATLARNRMGEMLRAAPVPEDPAAPPTVPEPVTPSEAVPPAPVRPEAVRPVPVEPGPAAVERAAPQPAVAAGDLAVLTGIRHFSDAAHTRIVLDLDRTVAYQTGEAREPERLFIDLQGLASPAPLSGATARGAEQVISIGSASVARVRVGNNQPGVVRVVIDFASVPRYTLFTLARDGVPFRIVIDVPTDTVAGRVRDERRPPAPSGESLAEQLGLGVRKIVIDPGHGGSDPGAIGRSGITEKQLTLALSEALAERLRSAGYEVVLTRDSDRTVDLQDRTEFANNEGADLFLSIHVNSARNRNLRGFETYYLNLANDSGAAETAARENAVGLDGGLADLGSTLETIVKNEFQGASSELAASIQDSLVMHVSKTYAEVRDLGVKTAPFYVLVGARMPAVLIEASFVSNAEEETLLKTPDYRVQLAEAIEIGLQSYLDQRKITATTGR